MKWFLNALLFIVSHIKVKYYIEINGEWILTNKRELLLKFDEMEQKGNAKPLVISKITGTPDLLNLESNKLVINEKKEFLIKNV
jgi:hypothetical protein